MSGVDVGIHHYISLGKSTRILHTPLFAIAVRKPTLRSSQIKGRSTPTSESLWYPNRQHSHSSGLMKAAN